jgi:transcriptional regulator with XRE-family HTH domain
MELINLENIDRHIRRIREMQGLSRGELSERSGRSVSWIRLMEVEGVSNPGIKTIQDIAHGLGFTLRGLLKRCRQLDEMSHADTLDAQPEGRSG